MLVFVPLTADELAAWAQTGHHRPARGYAVTPSLSAAFGFGPADAEDAEHTALHIAGLAGLAYVRPRLQLAAFSAGWWSLRAISALEVLLQAAKDADGWR